MKRHFQCAEQAMSTSNLSKYCACHAKWIPWLIRVTHETSFTMRGACTVSHQPHQILRLPRNLQVQDCIGNSLNCFRQYKDDSRIIRAWSEHEIVISHPPLRRSYSSDLEHDFVLKNTTFRAPAISQNVTKCCACHEKSHSNFTKYCACHAKCISWLIRVTYETSFRMRGASKVNLERHQILRLPRKMNLMIDPRHIWNVISNARSNQSQPRTSPNTAPATQNESHDWSVPHMKRHFQCAEQAKSTSNLSKYCACHAKWIPWLICVTHETSFTMRGASTVSHQPHQILRLPRNL